VGQCSSGYLNSNNLPGGVVGSVGFKIVDGDVKEPTVTELAMRVIPLVKTLKTELVEVQLALKVLSSFQSVVNQLKEDVDVLNTKYGGLDARLVKTNAVLKSLNDWSIAYDFTRINHGSVTAPVNISSVAPWKPAPVGAFTPSDAVPSVGTNGQLLVVSAPLKLSLFDLDNMMV